MSCPSCGAENPGDKKFCGDCGAPLAAVCPSCGVPAEAGKRFCGDCGAALTGVAPATAPASGATPNADPVRRVAERRLTTILFGDLVGFTKLSEHRDAEDTREMLSQYFATASTVVARYGGTIEKFIGDAVMAVWGVPTAHEDDAERAVRAGLDLIAQMGALSEKVGVPGLTMRIGVVTGEVAVTLGAVGEGMVAGDAVNTAARIQSAAEPGQVWVDETTRSITSAAVSYTDVGAHELKGKSEPVHLHWARAIVASVGGAQRVDGLEAPFLGRDHELRLVKELFHAALDEGRPRLVAVYGVAGVGKTRLIAEVEHYVDGITQLIAWHRGRVLSYGDGVSFWALAEMVRSRLGITDGEASEAIDGKLGAGVERFFADENEREWIRPRLAVLLGLESARADDQTTFARNDLFAAWATFFDRVREGEGGTVLIFDDMQYADPDLLDFLDHLLESARYPLFVMTLARPELVDARPGWGSGRRATTLYLEPLSESVMTEIVNGLVEGLPGQAGHALVERSEGIPLYALEMVRGLIDRDAVIPQEGRYVLAPDADTRVDLTTLDAPPSLQALIAARLDALSAGERQVVQDAAVHGLVFSRDALETVTTVPDLEAILEELVRKEIFAVHTDRFSPERGQFRFVQALVRTVAYDMLARRDRKSRHLAVARYLERISVGDEVAAVIARHYLDALDSDPDDADANELTSNAMAQLERAARRAEGLGSPEEALRHYTAALGREPGAEDRARLLEGATRAARASNRMEDWIALSEQARAAYDVIGDPVGAGRALALLGEAHLATGHAQHAIDVMVPIYDRLADVPDAETAVVGLAENLARAWQMRGDAVTAQQYSDRAMQLAEATQDWARVASQLNRQAVIWTMSGRPTGSIALLRAAIEIGRREHLPRAMIVPLLNISAFYKNRELDTALSAGREAVELTLQSGALDLVRSSAMNLAITCWVSGDWDEVEDLYTRHAEDLTIYPSDLMLTRSIVALVRHARGQAVDFELVVPDDELDESEQSDYAAALVDAVISELAGDGQAAAAAYARGVDRAHVTSGLDDDFPVLWPLAIEALLAGGQLEESERVLAYVADAPKGVVTALAHAHLLRLRALIDIANGADPDSIATNLQAATQEFRDFGARFYLARTLLERAQRLSLRGEHEAAAPLRDEAEALFTTLGANRWLGEVRAVSSPRA